MQYLWLLTKYSTRERGDIPLVQQVARQFLACADASLHECLTQGGEIWIEVERTCRARARNTKADKRLVEPAGRVAVNACYRRRRSRWWRVWHAVNPAVDIAELSVSGPTPEAQAVTMEEHRIVLAVFNRLSRRQQEVFLLRHVEGYSTDEVATILGVRTGSVKRHLFRATHAFQKTLRTARDPRAGVPHA